MSADVETPINLPTFPRPTSLYVPDVSRSVPLLDTSSYSPFPTFPGTGNRSRDPYGLNAFLLHPDDTLWHYVDPMPDSKAQTGTTDRTDPEAKQHQPRLQLNQQVKKQRSMSGLKNPSPLSQPPLNGKEDTVDETVVTLQRRRSSSLSSSPTLSPEDEVEIIAAFRDDATPGVKLSKNAKSGKKSLRRAFTMARKSVFGAHDNEVPPVPLVSEAPALVAPSISAITAESIDPSTPMSSRSPSNYSTVSSASSTSSSEGIKTPSEGISPGILITGSKLANALQEAGDKKAKGKGWKWLGKKVSKSNLKITTSSGSSTPGSDRSAGSTPNTSTSDLLASGVPQGTLTPSATSNAPSRTLSPVMLPSELLDKQHTWASEQLRRVSLRKLSQLRNPSPHPLALALRRQHSKLPDEVAFSIRSDQRVFPMSVNSHKGSEGDLVPAQGGLWLNIAISKVMYKLDQGEQPDGILKTRRAAKNSTIARPRGVLDFINRPPYEERNIVYYPDSVFSPISMARPGYGVWDLDFSSYILALSAIDEPGSAWPAMPRASLENASDDFANAITAYSDETNAEVEQVEVVAAGQEAVEQDSIATLKVLTAKAPSEPALQLPSVETAGACQPLSSFRPAGGHIGSSTESESDESESEDDDEPLARVVAKRRSQSFQVQPRPALAVLPAPRPVSVHALSAAQPTPLPAKSRNLTTDAELKWKDAQQRAAMDQVAKARERREANRTGEVEKRAISEQILAKEQAKRRSSMLNLQDAAATPSMRHKRNSSSVNLGSSRPTSYHSASQGMLPSVEAGRRRSQADILPQPSTQPSSRRLSPSRPDTHRSRTGPSPASTPVPEKKRYHSFYEQRAVSGSTSALHTSTSSTQHYAQGGPHPHARHVMRPSSQHIVHQMPPMMPIPVYAQPHQMPTYGMQVYPSPQSISYSVPAVYPGYATPPMTGSPAPSASRRVSRMT
ncbi:hypothetical protein IAU60_004455 [Kwoniella sp. DSM 27419]